jgi:ribosomal protein S18 acetylase RimI-like enzyme
MTHADDGDVVVTSDPAAVDLDAVHAFLTATYWSPGIPRETVARAIAGSIPFSVLWKGQQVGFARVITDRATFAYLADVYVLQEYRGRGLAVRLMDAIMAHPDLQGLRRFLLVTRNAHGLYRRYGFTDLANPSMHLERVNPDVYRAT